MDTEVASTTNDNAIEVNLSVGKIDVSKNRKVVEPQEVFMEESNKTNNEIIASEKEALPRWFPHFCGKPVFYGNVEALGYVIEGSGRAIALISASAFLLTTLLNKVKVDAGCEIEAPVVGETVAPCDNRVYGIRPSSVLTVFAVAVNLVSAIIMPLFGAIVDYTPHRKLMGRWLSFIFCLLMIPSIFVMELPWEVVAVCFFIMSATSWGEVVVCNAYIPELTNDERQLNYFTTMFVAIPFGATVMFLIGVVAISYGLQIHEDNGKVAKLSQISAFVICALCLGLVWTFFLKKRPPKNQLEPGKRIYTEGFKQIYRTSCDIYKNYHALKWFYIGTAFGEAALVAIAPILLNYQIDVLLFSSVESGTGIFISLMSTIPGAVVGSFVTKLSNPIWSSIIAITILAATTGIYAGILVGPGQQMQVYVLLLGMGMASGWKWTCDKMLAASLIPRGQEAELMALHSSSAIILSWLPPVIFTAMNEALIDQRIGIAVVNVYFLLAIGCYIMMGSYKDALARVDRLPQQLLEQDVAEKQGEMVGKKEGGTDMKEGRIEISVPTEVW